MSLNSFNPNNNLSSNVTNESWAGAQESSWHDPADGGVGLENERTVTQNVFFLFLVHGELFGVIKGWELVKRKNRLSLYFST